MKGFGPDDPSVARGLNRPIFSWSQKSWSVRRKTDTDRLATQIVAFFERHGIKVLLELEDWRRARDRVLENGTMLAPSVVKRCVVQTLLHEGYDQSERVFRQLADKVNELQFKNDLPEWHQRLVSRYGGTGPASAGDAPR